MKKSLNIDPTMLKDVRSGLNVVMNIPTETSLTLLNSKGPAIIFIN